MSSSQLLWLTTYQHSLGFFCKVSVLHSSCTPKSWVPKFWCKNEDVSWGTNLKFNYSSVQNQYRQKWSTEIHIQTSANSFFITIYTKMYVQERGQISILGDSEESEIQRQFLRNQSEPKCLVMSTNRGSIVGQLGRIGWKLIDKNLCWHQQIGLKHMSTINDLLLNSSGTVWPEQKLSMELLHTANPSLQRLQPYSTVAVNRLTSNEETSLNCTSDNILSALAKNCFQQVVDNVVPMQRLSVFQ